MMMMKNTYLFLLLLVCLFPASASAADATAETATATATATATTKKNDVIVAAVDDGSSQIQSQIQSQRQERQERRRRRRHLSPGTVCTLFLKHIQYERGAGAAERGGGGLKKKPDSSWSCELTVPVEIEIEIEVEIDDEDEDEDEEDRELSPAKKVRKKRKRRKKRRKEKKMIIEERTMMLDIEGVGLDLKYFESVGALSGESTMMISEGYLEGDNEYEDEYVDEEGKDSAVAAAASTASDTTEFSVPVPAATATAWDAEVVAEDNEPLIMSATTTTSSSSSSSSSSSGSNMIMTKLVIPSTAIVEVNDVVIANYDSSLLDGYDNTDEDEDRDQDIVSRSRSQRSRNLVSQTGDIKTAVVIVRAKNNLPVYDKSTMRQIVFTGATDNGNTISLRDQMNACTYDQFRINPANNGIDTTGIFEITVNVTPKSGNERQIEAQAKIEFSNKYGSKNQYGLILYCLPGNTGSWVAYAYVNGNESFYNDYWCARISALQHEIGHSLNLGHSGEQEIYDDQSGMMGYSYNDMTIPKMCYNAAKNYQLNWYNNQKVDYNPMASNLPQTKTFIMNGITAYKPSGPTNGRVVVLRLSQNNSNKQYYIGYNRASDFNSQTQEYRDCITIIEKEGSATGYAPSKIKKALCSRNQIFTISNWGGDPKISIVIKYQSNSDNYEDVTIAITRLGGPTIPPTKTPTPPPTRPPTRPPTKTPTPPTRSPTKTPTPPPTRQPSIAPSTSSAPTEYRGPCENLITYFWQGNPSKTCDTFVAIKPRIRCNKKDAVTGKALRQYCPATCKARCKNTSSPSTSSDNNLTNNTNNCIDRDDFKRNNRKRLNCAWVGRKKTRKRCNIVDDNKKVSEYWCRATCSKYNNSCQN